MYSEKTEKSLKFQVYNLLMCLYTSAVTIKLIYNAAVKFKLLSLHVIFVPFCHIAPVDIPLFYNGCG